MIQLVEDIKDANAITHAGSFHADDVFSTVFLSKIQDIYLYRTNEIDEKYKEKIVYDIGRGKFDHHGEDARIRENGIKYSSFGLLFEHYGKEYLKKKKVQKIDDCYELFLKEFILQIDAIDNGIFPKREEKYNITSLSQVIELFNPTWKEEQSSNEAFQKALEIGLMIFNRMEKRILDKILAKDMVEEKIKKSENHLLILEEYLPFMDFLLNSQEKKAKEIYFCIYPSRRGGFNIQAILKSENTHQNRMDFPKEWGGKAKEELVALTNITGFHFCHSSLFLCACDTLEEAKKIANMAMKKN